MITRRDFRMVGMCVGVLLAAVAWSAMGSEIRVGGRGVFFGSAMPYAGGSAEIDVFAGFGSLEASSTTELSLFPYTTSSETVAVALVRDWLCLAVEYEFSVVPLGITAARILARATPAAWMSSYESFLVDGAVEAEARLLGDGFAATPLRAELWLKGSLGIGASLGMIDFARVGAAIEGTLSAPNGSVWPTPSLIASASLGPATLSSETEWSLAGGIHVVAETVSLVCSWHELGFSAKAWCTFSGEPTGPSAGLRIAYEFGATPLRPFPDSTACVGGVCY
ncbi:MAG: hypothetical protein PHW86_05220 [Candidatus Bipolaricaulis sp.]|nr:hypothetical protein [Candidatus Bipolaricaulis sp.]